MNRLIEPFAGYAAYSLRALWMAGGRAGRAEPPVSRMGSKAGFAPGVFRAWNLSRARWSAVLLNDLDPVCHLVHRVYADPALRQAVARQIWAWVPCPVCLPWLVQAALEGRSKPTPEYCLDARYARAGDCEVCSSTGVRSARALWESIRSAPVPDDLVKAAASALFLQSRSFSLTPILIEGSVWLEKGWKPEVDQQFRQRDGGVINDDSPRWTVADRLEALSGRWVEHGYCPETKASSWGHVWPRHETADRLELLPGPSGCQIEISRLDALEFVRGIELTSSDVLIVDPPYLETTGYQATSARDTVLEIADRGHRSGALVLVHEAVGLAKDLGAGWLERPATPLRSRKSGFWKDGLEREWLTFNRAPVYWPAEQTGFMW